MDEQGHLRSENLQADIVSPQEDLAVVAEAGLGANGGGAAGTDPEFALLCACCGASRQDPEIADLLQRPLNWERLFKIAKHHRVLPAVCLALGERVDLPASIGSAMRARFASHSLQALRFSAELTGILQQFGKHGIQAVPHKGPVLSQMLYGDPAMRQFGDLDLLVEAADVRRARAALGELGYEGQLQLSRRQEEEYFRSGYEIVLGTESEKNLIELQWQILPRFYSVAFQMDSLLARAVEFDFEGCRTRVLRNEDLMLGLCAHAAKHEWAHLGMVRDIAAVAQMGLDWEWVEAEARRLGILNILTVSLLLARNLLGRELPGNLSVSRAVEGIASAVQDGLVRSEDADSESLRYFRFMMRLREKWQDRLRFGWRLASTPSVGEWKAVDIPDFLFPLYRGVRVLRLGRRLFSGD